MTRSITLLSTVVAPSFDGGNLYTSPIPASELAGALGQVTRNLCGHPLTLAVLRELCPALPEAERGFWDGSTPAIAVRPRGGVRAARSEGDTQVELADLEAVMVRWQPAEGF